MRTIEVAMAMLRQNDTYLLQRRPASERIGAAGLIGCFGGQIEPSESSLQAVAREIGEETNLDLPAESYTLIGRVKVPSDRDLEPVEIHADVFAASIPADVVVAAKDGSVESMTLEEMRANIVLLAPATAAVVEQLMRKDNYA